jgi:type II secretory ATPase GspE/PulE/Tfp pilus assembly ATPase PilB-like protein/nucleotide-binding universal stress UspA family protein
MDRQYMEVADEPVFFSLRAKMPLFRNILAPTDFSRNSVAAVNYACDLARDSKSTLHLLHASIDLADDRKVEHLERIGAMLENGNRPSVDTVQQVISGEPEHIITEYARKNDVDLIVMGTHGRTGLKHLTMGSVAEHVIRNAPCPVLVLGPHDAEGTSLRHAAQVLADLVGDGMDAGMEAGRGQLLRQLVKQLRIASTTAILMLDELEDRNWIRWNDGKWTVGRMQAFDEFEPLHSEPTTDWQVTNLIRRAHRLRATDIHIDPQGREFDRVRFRVDGRLQNCCTIPRLVTNHLINQLKMYARLDIADPFHAQEGHLQLPSTLSRLDVRMTTIPVADGQAVAMRLFDPAKVFLPLENLGLSERALTEVNSMLQNGEGMILVTGPTGAGKTTTVHSMLRTLAETNQNIVSIEDPVEFVAPYVRQVNVDIRHGLTMAEGLRTILRMDPDVLFIGEIRDPQTAEIAMRAASSGKYVFSTMHTRDISSTIVALRELGLGDRSLATNLTGIINQRLVRRLCSNCQLEFDISDHQQEHFVHAGLEVPEKLFESVGCEECGATGYLGRIGVFEVSRMDDAIRKAIMAQKSSLEMNDLFRSLGNPDLNRDALSKAAAGLISFDEAVGIRWFAQ